MSFKRFVKNEIFRIASGAILLVSAIILGQFDISIVSLALYILAILVCGINVFAGAIKGILRGDVFDENLLMSIAAVGAMLIGEYTEGVAIMLFFLVGETFEHRAIKHSRASIRSLMDICPDEACVLTDGGECTVDAEDVEPGAVIVIRPGERVPLDCVVEEGTADVDTSSMTGESMPISVIPGTTLSSGYIVLSGLLRCRVLRVASESAAARVLELVEYANERKSREERFITKFSRYYTPTVVICAVLLAIIPSLVGITEWSDSIHRALIFLVISCPCALVISVPMAFFGGIGGAASRGILYKGGNVFSAVAKADTVAFDKTGTITSGEFAISEIIPISSDADRVLSLAMTAEYSSNHPLARSVMSQSHSYDIPDESHEIAGEGVVATLGTQQIAVGNKALMNRFGVDIESVRAPASSVYVALDGTLAGILVIADKIKAEAQATVAELHSLGIKRTVILSGDRRENVEYVKDKLDIDEAFAELTPEDKYNKLEQIIEKSRSTIYVGDGINDAPALARADVGLSMGKMGQDSAIEASDVVIMSDNLQKIPEAIRISRKTLGIAKQNIVFALSVKGAILILGALGIANMWLAVFADVGVAVIAILNSMRSLHVGTRK